MKRILVANVIFVFCLPMGAQECDPLPFPEMLGTTPGSDVGEQLNLLPETEDPLDDWGPRVLAPLPTLGIQAPVLAVPVPKRQRWQTSDRLSPRWVRRRATPPVPRISRRQRQESALSGTGMRLGSTKYYDFDNGVSGMSARIGKFTYYDLSNGISGTSTRMGRFVYHDFSNGVSGTSTRMGSFTYHDFSDGTSVTSHKLGSFTYHDFNDGTSCVTQKIGDFTYTDCN